MFWNKVRWPLIIASICLLILIVWLIGYRIFVAKHVESVLALAEFNEFTGEITRIEEAEAKVAELYREYPGWDTVRVAYAWQSLFRSELMGLEKKNDQKTRKILGKGSGETDQDGLLALGMSQYLDGKYKDSIKTAKEGLRLYSDVPRFALLNVWAMSKVAKFKKLSNFVKAKTAKYPEYIPLILFAVKKGSEQGTLPQKLFWLRKLLNISPNHIYGKLMFVEARLPRWGESFVKREQLAALKTETRQLLGSGAKTSPIAKQLGLFLRGRIDFYSGNLEKAREAFRSLVETYLEPKYVAWLGQTLFEMEGPDAVLAMLDAHTESKSQEIAELKARSLLSHHRVEQARKIVDDMKAAPCYRKTNSANRVEWLLATREGRTEDALALLPEAIRDPYQFAALELYWQLKDLGHSQGIEKVTRSLEPRFFACSKAISAWHGKRAKKVLKIHASSRHENDTCIHALGAHSLRTYVPVDDVAKAANRATKGAKDENAWIETDRAVVEWMQKGQKSGAEILNRVLARKPEGPPLKYQIARAFLEIDMPEKAYETVNVCDTPEAIAICISALQKLKREEQAHAMIKKAVAMSTRNDHPALYPFKIAADLSRNSNDKAVETARQLSIKAGAWAVNAADEFLAVLSKKGENDAIDLYLQRLPRYLASTAGQDIVWKVNEFGMHYNLIRGKKYQKRALEIINNMENANVRSARFLYGLGVLKLGHDNARTAVKHFEEALIYNPTFLPASRRLAKIGKLKASVKKELALIYPSKNLKFLQ